MRIAVLTDIHANRLALDAVLEDIARQGGADEYWVLGDLVAFGAMPAAVLDRISALPNRRHVVGNTDVYVRSGMRPRPSRAEVQADATLLPVFEEVALSIGWTQGAIMATGWMDFLDALPLEERVTLPDGTRVLCVHAEPGKENGVGLRPGLDQDDLMQRFAGADADLVLVGHTHWPTNMQLGRVHAVNPGSVGNPLVPNLHAAYAMLEADRAGYTIRHRLVPFDVQAALDQLHAVRFPSPDYPASFLRGDRIKPWPLPPIDQSTTPI